MLDALLTGFVLAELSLALLLFESLVLVELVFHLLFQVGQDVLLVLEEHLELDTLLSPGLGFLLLLL